MTEALRSAHLRTMLGAVLIAFGLGLAIWQVAAQVPGPPRAALLEIDGPIGAATSDYFARAHKKAVNGGARLIIVRMDTPGGLDTAMRDIIKVILASPVPVAAYVAPSGARAASAGTYILYAAHIAAMAPATATGAATPVRMGMPSPPQNEPPAETGKNKAEKSKAQKSGGNSEKSPAIVPGDAMERKAVNDAVAFIRGLAERRGRNADWAERAVREGVSLSSQEALKQNVIDLVASNLDELLAMADGRSIATDGRTITLSTKGMQVERHEPDWRSRFLSVITSPTLAIILLLIGAYGLMFEGLNPGAIVPGVVGGICLLVALFALQAMPVTYSGVALIVLGIVLMIAEALAPSFGALGFGGIAALALGAVMLVDTDVPGFGVNRGIIIGIALGSSALMATTLYLVRRTRRLPVAQSDVIVPGTLAEVLEFQDGRGWARLQGEHWRILSRSPLVPGQTVKISRAEGLTLHVEPAPDSLDIPPHPTT